MAATTSNTLSDWDSDFAERIERALSRVISAAVSVTSSPKLARALEYAVFPGGARIRPALCLAVAKACGDRYPALSDATAAAVELLHCASLVHDDLPCFDDAATRRGRPSLHRVFGEGLAVLAGDGLIVLAFKSVLGAQSIRSDQISAILSHLSNAVVGADSLIAGQSWEAEDLVDLDAYHRAKTGALFQAAAVCGAVAAGVEGKGWSEVGMKLGQAYQIADDIADSIGGQQTLDKLSATDAVLGRPNAVRIIGVKQAISNGDMLFEEAIQSIPRCELETNFRTWLLSKMLPLIQQKTSGLV